MGPALLSPRLVHQWPIVVLFFLMALSNGMQKTILAYLLLCSGSIESINVLLASLSLDFSVRYLCFLSTGPHVEHILSFNFFNLIASPFLIALRNIITFSASILLPLPFEVDINHQQTLSSTLGFRCRPSSHISSSICSRF